MLAAADSHLRPDACLTLSLSDLYWGLVTTLGLAAQGQDSQVSLRG